MKLRDWMKNARHSSVTLGDKINVTSGMVRHVRSGRKKASVSLTQRLFWVSKGQVRPEDLGIDPALVLLPPLSKLPDPDVPGTTWERSCAATMAVEERLVAQEEAAESEGANP